MPICPEVLAMLNFAKTLRKHRSAYIWCFGRSNHPINKQCLSKWLNSTSLNGKLCHHGLRATGRTWLRDTNVPHEVAEDCLAHLSGSATERAYLRGDYLEQRKPIMQNGGIISLMNIVLYVLTIFLHNKLYVLWEHQLSIDH